VYTQNTWIKYALLEC